MEGDIATPVAFKKFDAALGEEFRGGSHISGFGVAPESDDRRVFEQEQDVANLFRFAQLDELLLEAETGGVVNRAELDDSDQIRTASSPKCRNT
jgi:hypothetical protein